MYYSLARKVLLVTMDDTSEAAIVDSRLSRNYGSVPASEYELSTATSHNDMPLMSHISISAMLSTAFSYGCIMTTLFLLTLPIECQRIEQESSEYYSYTIRKSIALGVFAAIAGLSQFISPLVGLLSDNFEPKGKMRQLGKRLPYLIFGTILVVIGMVGQLYSSSPIHILAGVDTENNSFISGKTVTMGGAWLQYSIFFMVSSVGLNIAYTVMLAMIPEYVPRSQTGAANGTLALMVILGSFFGFGMFHLVMSQSVLAMYKLYSCVGATSGIITYIQVRNREHVLAERRKNNCESELDERERVPAVQTVENCGNNSVAQVEQAPAIHELGFVLLYEPLLTKTQSEILSAFWIDISHHHDFFVVTISR